MLINATNNAAMAPVVFIIIAFRCFVGSLESSLAPHCSIKQTSKVRLV